MSRCAGIPDAAQMIVKIVNEELCKLMGNETKHLTINPNGPTVVMWLACRVRQNHKRFQAGWAPEGGKGRIRCWLPVIFTDPLLLSS